MLHRALIRIERFIRHWPFLTLGLGTLALFIAQELLGAGSSGLTALIRVLVTPLWFMRELEMVVGIGFWPQPLQFLIALPLLFLPYVLLDVLLHRVRAHRARRAVAA